MPEDKKMQKRYFVKVELKSGFVYNLTAEEQSFEYYFEVGRKGSNQRTPTRGYFSFKTRGAVELKSTLPLYTEIIASEPDKLIDLPLYFKEKNKSVFKMDETATFFKITIKLGEGAQTKKIQENNIELRLLISAVESNF